jgi:hypothetical protein
MGTRNEDERQTQERHDIPFKMQKGAEEVVSQKTVVQRPIEEKSSCLFVKRSRL